MSLLGQKGSAPNPPVFLQVSPLERSPKKGLSFRCCAALGNLSGKKAPDCSAGGFCNTLNGKQLIS